MLLSGIGLSLAVIVMSLAGSSAEDSDSKVAAACHGNPAAFAGPSGPGRILGFLSADQATKLLQSTQFSSHMAVNPDYLANLRTVVHLDNAPEGYRTVYLVPQGMKVAIGDHVTVAGGRIDPSLPCHYVPNLIVGIDNAGK